MDIIDGLKEIADEISNIRVRLFNEKNYKEAKNTESLEYRLRHLIAEIENENN